MNPNRSWSPTTPTPVGNGLKSNAANKKEVLNELHLIFWNHLETDEKQEILKCCKDFQESTSVLFVNKEKKARCEDELKRAITTAVNNYKLENSNVDDLVLKVNGLLQSLICSNDLNELNANYAQPKLLFGSLFKTEKVSQQTLDIIVGVLTYGHLDPGGRITQSHQVVDALKTFKQFSYEYQAQCISRMLDYFNGLTYLNSEQSTYDKRKEILNILCIFFQSYRKDESNKPYEEKIHNLLQTDRGAEVFLFILSQLLSVSENHFIAKNIENIMQNTLTCHPNIVIKVIKQGLSSNDSIKHVVEEVLKKHFNNFSKNDQKNIIDLYLENYEKFPQFFGQILINIIRISGLSYFNDNCQMAIIKAFVISKFDADPQIEKSISNALIDELYRGENKFLKDSEKMQLLIVEAICNKWIGEHSGHFINYFLKTSLHKDAKDKIVQLMWQGNKINKNLLQIVLNEQFYVKVLSTEEKINVVTQVMIRKYEGEDGAGDKKIVFDRLSRVLLADQENRSSSANGKIIPLLFDIIFASIERLLVAKEVYISLKLDKIMGEIDNQFIQELFSEGEGAAKAWLTDESKLDKVLDSSAVRVVPPISSDSKIKNASVMFKIDHRAYGTPPASSIYSNNSFDRGWRTYNMSRSAPSFVVPLSYSSKAHKNSIAPAVDDERNPSNDYADRQVVIYYIANLVKSGKLNNKELLIIANNLLMFKDENDQIKIAEAIYNGIFSRNSLNTEEKYNINIALNRNVSCMCKSNPEVATIIFNAIIGKGFLWDGNCSNLTRMLQHYGLLEEGLQQIIIDKALDRFDVDGLLVLVDNIDFIFPTKSVQAKVINKIISLNKVRINILVEHIGLFEKNDKKLTLISDIANRYSGRNQHNLVARRDSKWEIPQAVAVILDNKFNFFETNLKSLKVNDVIELANTCLDSALTIKFINTLPKWNSSAMKAEFFRAVLTGKYNQDPEVLKTLANYLELLLPDKGIVISAIVAAILASIDGFSAREAFFASFRLDEIIGEVDKSFIQGVFDNGDSAAKEWLTDSLKLSAILNSPAVNDERNLFNDYADGQIVVHYIANLVKTDGLNDEELLIIADKLFMFKDKNDQIKIAEAIYHGVFSRNSLSEKQKSDMMASIGGNLVFLYQNSLYAKVIIFFAIIGNKLSLNREKYLDAPLIDEVVGIVFEVAKGVDSTTDEQIKWSEHLKYYDFIQLKQCIEQFVNNNADNIDNATALQAFKIFMGHPSTINPKNNLVTKHLKVVSTPTELFNKLEWGKFNVDEENVGTITSLLPFTEEGLKPTLEYDWLNLLVKLKNNLPNLNKISFGNNYFDWNSYLKRNLNGWHQINNYKIVTRQNITRIKLFQDSILFEELK